MVLIVIFLSTLLKMFIKRTDCMISSKLFISIINWIVIRNLLCTRAWKLRAKFLCEMYFRAFLCANEEFFHSAFSTRTLTANLYRCINGTKIMFSPFSYLLKSCDRKMAEISERGHKITSPDSLLRKPQNSLGPRIWWDLNSKWTVNFPPQR